MATPRTAYLTLPSLSLDGRWKGRPFRIRVFPGGITLALDMDARVRVYTYDALGRPWTFLLHGRTYRRGLNGFMLVKWREPGHPRARKRLAPAEARAVEARARQELQAWVAALQREEATTSQPIPERVWTLLQRALEFDPHRSREDALTFTRIYRPIGILPPDRYLDVVVQITEGCSFNTCTFCTFYRGQRFRIRTVDEVQAHVQALRAYLGEALFMRRGIFLGAANALTAPMPRLLQVLRTVRKGFPEARFADMYAFLDGFSGRRKTPQDYAALRDLGLKRVYIGLESGDPELLAFLKKPGTPDDAIQAVHAMKEAGIHVGIIVLLGAGGDRFAQQHVEATIRVLRNMHLGPGDLLYFSELVITPDMPYAQEAIKEGIRPLTPKEQREQMEAILRGLAYPKGQGPKISKYDIREFIY